MPRLRPVIAAAVLLFPPVASAVHAQTTREEEGVRPEVTQLRIRGAQSVDDRLLRQSIATDESRCRSALVAPICWVVKSSAVYDRHYLSRSELGRDMFRIRVFYFKRGWREVEVDTVVTGNDERVSVTIEVREGEPTRLERIAVRRPDGILDDRRVEGLVSLRAGEPLNLIDLDSSRVRLANALWDMGYSDAVVRADSVTVTPDNRLAAVLIEIEPRFRATVGEIRITGNQKVADRTILNSLPFEVGDVYRRRDLLRGQRSLYDSELFRRAQILVPPQGDTAKIVEVTVDEALLRGARIAGGFNTADFVQVEAGFVNRNWSGGARRLELGGVVGNLFASGLNGVFPFRDVLRDAGENRDEFTKPTWRTWADFRQPWFQSELNTIGAGVFGARRAATGIYVDRSYGATGTFTREVAERAPASITYRFERTRVSASDIYFCVNYGVCDLPTVAALQEERLLSPLSLTGSITRSNDLLNPTAGYVARLELEHASQFTMSDYRYNRIAADGAVYRQINERLTLAAHLRLGWVKALESTADAIGVETTTGESILHPRRRFYAGGAQSVRGYPESQLGPRILTIPPEDLVDRRCTLTPPSTVICPEGAINGDADPTDEFGPLDDDDFTPRPVGGRTLAEASVELRFPLWRNLGGAAFIDGALVGTGTLADITSGTGAITPGVGIRYYSPVGPIRVDIGFNPFITENLAVLSQVGEGPTAELAPVQTRLSDGSLVQATRAYAPAKNDGGLSGFLRQLTVHFSIGQAF
jgi:outer membrane protein insertion porin family/translocation and assembly module TamA